MKYLVKSHLGGYYTSDKDPSIIECYCEQCGDSDSIMLSWNEENKLETLSNYLTRSKMDENEIREDLITGSTKEELVDYMVYQYDDDKYMIKELANDKELTKKEKVKLLKQVYNAQKQQLELINNTNEKVLIRKRSNK